MFRSFRRIAISACLLAAAQAHATVAPSNAAQSNVVVVLNSRDATVQLLDQTSYKSLQTFAVGKEPHHLMATPDNKSLVFWAGGKLQRIEVATKKVTPIPFRVRGTRTICVASRCCRSGSSAIAPSC